MKKMQPSIHKKSKLVIYSFLFLLIFNGCSSQEDDSPTEVDTEAPTAPTKLVAENTTLTSTTLRWEKSTDNVGVSTYLIFKDGENLAANTDTERIIDGLESNSTYTFKVRAKDKAGNLSGFSNELSVTTIAPEAELQYVSGNLESYLGNLIDEVPGSSGNDFSEPTDNDLIIWDTVIDAIVTEDLELAVEKAAAVNYKITEFTDNTLSPEQVFYILEDNSLKSNFWGTYVFSKTPESDRLVIQAPHIKFDTNTGKQAVHVFKENVARALFLSGTHRCNHSEKTSCSGQTSVCSSGLEAYPISDMAHNATSAFQQTTENLFNNFSSTVFIQLHGFGKKSSDPYVIMSNGTRDTPTDDYAVQIRDALLTEDNTLTFKIAHLDTDWTRLNGFTNTQGRLINNSPNPCESSATTATGRFIHIEQEKSRLREGPAEWAKMSNALDKVF